MRPPAHPDVIGLVALALVMGAPTALAFDPMPLNHQSGGVKITPTIELEQGYDDNVDQAPSGDTQSSWVTRLKPKVEASGQHQGNTYSLSYRPQLKSFDSENDRVRHTLNAQAEIRLNRRNQIKGRVNASRDQAAPNETNRAVGETEGNINKRGSFLATYTLGAENAAGELTVDVGQTWNRFANNRGVEGSNKQSEEYDSTRLGVGFAWRISPRTRLLAEADHEAYDYTWSQSTLDNQSLTGRLGVSWEATGKTDGVIRLGRQTKRFDDPGKSSTSAQSWDARLTWRPLDHVSWRLTTGNRLAEGSQSAADAVREKATEDTRAGLSLSYDWNSRVSSNLGYRWLRKDYLASSGANQGRVDETETVSVGVDYTLRRWVLLGVNAAFAEKDSSLGRSASYDQNTLFFTATVGL